MRYDENDRESQNVEDMRGRRRGGFGFPGGMGFPGAGRGRPIRIPVGRGGFSLTTLLIIGAIMLLLGINPLDLLRGGGSPSGAPDYSEVPQMPRVDAGPDRRASNDPFEIPRSAGEEPSSDELAAFVRRVLADTEDVWNRAFR